MEVARHGIHYRYYRGTRASETVVDERARHHFVREDAGAGRDICSDRLATERVRRSGEELVAADPVEAANVEHGFSEGIFPSKKEAV